MEPFFEESCRKIDDEASDLRNLSESIWSNPELLFKEKKSHDFITDFLEKRGFQVERNYILDTAFIAHWEKGSDNNDGPNVMVICEYDALPGIGHACGHNLIAEAGVAAGLGVKAAMELSGGPSGKVTILGTPGEEGGGGKMYLIDGGAMKGVDVAMMVHPAPTNILAPEMIACSILNVTYHGKSAHAAAFPFEGINALDAAVHAYTAISHMRQQLRKTARVHGVITNGGAKANIIPDMTKMEYIIREETLSKLEALTVKVENCFQAAALATGCKVEINYECKPYRDLIPNDCLAAVYERHILELQSDWLQHTTGDVLRGSTDMGNISYEVPSIHPMYHIGKEINHTKEFTAVARSDKAQENTINQGKAMAKTCIEIMIDKELLGKIQNEFKQKSAAPGF